MSQFEQQFNTLSEYDPITTLLPIDPILDLTDTITYTFNSENYTPLIKAINVNITSQLYHKSTPIEYPLSTHWSDSIPTLLDTIFTHSPPYQHHIHIFYPLKYFPKFHRTRQIYNNIPMGYNNTLITFNSTQLLNQINIPLILLYPDPTISPISLLYTTTTPKIFKYRNSTDDTWGRSLRSLNPHTPCSHPKNQILTDDIFIQ